MTADDRLADLARHLDSMPPVRAMAIRIDGCDAAGLALSAPLAANVNDKGCAFGGSLTSLMTLAAWALVDLRLAQAGLTGAEIYVQDSTVRYLAPVFEDLRTHSRLADAEPGWETFIDTFRSRGRARASLLAEVRLADGRVAASFEGRFVAKQPA
ncbi:MAG: YiiD C-terminal domain-containing protein [Lysobacteraceae bacterium]